MARRRNWGLPAAVVGTLTVGVIGGALIGFWIRHDPDRLASAPPPSASTIPLPPEPPAETVAPILPAPVVQLSSVPAIEPGLLIAHLFAWRGAGEPSPDEVKAYLALTQCAAFKTAPPTQQEALLAGARDKLKALSEVRRGRIAVSLPPTSDGGLFLPALTEPMRLRVAAGVPQACAELYAASGQPQSFDLRVTGPAPWPARHATGPASGSLFGDLVVDLAEPSQGGGGAGPTIAAQAVALYVWTDASRRAPVASLGHAAPDSQDAPAPPAVEAPLEAGPLAGKPVSADLARRAAQTSGVALPPISTAPRQNVETQSLPPPLISR